MSELLVKEPSGSHESLPPQLPKGMQFDVANDVSIQGSGSRTYDDCVSGILSLHMRIQFYLVHIPYIGIDIRRMKVSLGK